MRQRMIKVEAKDGLDVEPIHRVWIEGYAKLGQKPFKQFYSSNSVGFLEFQKHRQLATMFWLYDHLGFEIIYVFEGVVRKYYPDFLIKLDNGKTLVLEVKGQEKERDREKRRALAEWIEAVNNCGDFGEWCNDVSYNVGDIDGIIELHASK